MVSRAPEIGRAIAPRREWSQTKLDAVRAGGALWEPASAGLQCICGALVTILTGAACEGSQQGQIFFGAQDVVQAKAAEDIQKRTLASSAAVNFVHIAAILALQLFLVDGRAGWDAFT